MQIQKTVIFSNAQIYLLALTAAWHKESKHVTKECVNMVLDACKGMMDAYQLPQLADKNCLPSIHRPLNQHPFTHDWTSA